jgi:hypothetical protein
VILVNSGDSDEHHHLDLLQDVPQGCALSHDSRKGIHSAFGRCVLVFVHAGKVGDNISELDISVAGSKILVVNRSTGLGTHGKLEIADLVYHILAFLDSAWI